MKLLNYLLVFSFLSFFVSCSDDEGFRLSSVEEGFSSVNEELPNEDLGEPEQKKKCESKKAKKCEGYYLGDERDDDPKDKMTALNYDLNKLEDYTCEDGKVVFCHVPPGNANAAHYIKIDDNDEAIASHLDKISEDGGDVIYSYILKCEKYEGKKKKGGFFGKFFGKKKHHEEESEYQEDCEEEGYSEYSEGEYNEYAGYGSK